MWLSVGLLAITLATHGQSPHSKFQDRERRITTDLAEGFFHGFPLRFVDEVQIMDLDLDGVH